MPFNHPHADKSQDEIGNLPIGDQRELLADATKASSYFLAATINTGTGDGTVLDLTPVGEVEASKLVSGSNTTLTDAAGKEHTPTVWLDPGEHSLSDNTDASIVFKGMGRGEAIQENIRISGVIDRVTGAMKDSDAVRNAQAENAMRDMGLEARFHAVRNAGMDVDASDFMHLQGMFGTFRDGTSGQRGRSLSQALQENQNWKQWIDANASKPTWKNADKFEAEMGDIHPQDWFANARTGRFLNQPTAVLDDDNFQPETTRSGLIVMEPVRHPQITDYIPVYNTDQVKFTWRQETIVTDNVADFEQGDVLLESDIQLRDIEVAMTAIGHFMSWNEMAADDDAALEFMMNYRLPEMIRRALDTRIITGSGANKQLRGLANATGVQAYAAPNSESIIDSLHKMKTKARVDEASGKKYGMPNIFVLNAYDCEQVTLLKDTQGRYIYGNPAMTGPRNIWGLPMVEYDGGPVGTGYCGDFAMHSMLAMRKGITIDTGWYNQQFLKLERAIRAYIRCAMVWTRGQAFVKGTALGTAT